MTQRKLKENVDEYFKCKKGNTSDLLGQTVKENQPS